ncbi:MAG: segregation/condensation protein A [Clostridia bacterium]
MDIKKFSKKDDEYFRVVDGRVIAVESLLYGDDDDVFENKKDYRFDLSRYEGPLDLLLYLIKRNRIQIEEIFVADITQQYLDIIKPLQDWDESEIEYAGDFISMAAELIEYKSKRLIPTEQAEIETGELPGDSLIRRLQEYEMFKQMAEKLRGLETINRFYRSPVYTDEDYRIAIKDFDFGKMLDAYAMLMHRIERKEQQAIPKKIMKERFSVSNRMNYISQRVFEEKKVMLFDLLEDDFNKLEAINTFLAMLELLKRQVITVVQNEAFSNIEICLREGIEAPIIISEEEKELAKYSGNS